MTEAPRFRGLPICVLPAALYAAAEIAGCDMRGYAPQSPLPRVSAGLP